MMAIGRLGQDRGIAGSRRGSPGCGREEAAFAAGASLTADGGYAA